MKLTIEQTALKAAIARVLPAVAGKSTLPVLSNIKVVAEEGSDLLILSATNLEIGITATTADCQITDGGETTIPAKLLSDLIGSLPSARLTLSTNDVTEATTITCGRSRNTIKGIAAAEYPDLPRASQHLMAFGNADVLRHDLLQVIAAAADSDGRPALEGLLLRIRGQRVTFTCTDGFRLAVRSFEHPIDDIHAIDEIADLLIPARSLSALCSLLKGHDGPIDVYLTAGDAQIAFEVGGTTLTTRVIASQYPDYERIIPQSANTVITAGTAALLSAVRRASLFAATSGNVISLATVKDDDRWWLSVAASGAQTGDGADAVAVTIKGIDDVAKIALNARYLSEALGCVTSESVTLSLQSPEKPCVIRQHGDDGYLHLVMPMSVR